MLRCRQSEAPPAPPDLHAPSISARYRGSINGEWLLFIILSDLYVLQGEIQEWHPCAIATLHGTILFRGCDAPCGRAAEGGRTARGKHQQWSETQRSRKPLSVSRAPAATQTSPMRHWEGDRDDLAGAGEFASHWRKIAGTRPKGPSPSSVMDSFESPHRLAKLGRVRMASPIKKVVVANGTLCAPRGGRVLRATFLKQGLAGRGALSVSSGAGSLPKDGPRSLSFNIEHPSDIVETQAAMEAGSDARSAEGAKHGYKSREKALRESSGMVRIVPRPGDRHMAVRQSLGNVHSTADCEPLATHHSPALAPSSSPLFAQHGNPMSPLQVSVSMDSVLPRPSAFGLGASPRQPTRMRGRTASYDELVYASPSAQYALRAQAHMRNAMRVTAIPGMPSPLQTTTTLVPSSPMQRVHMPSLSQALHHGVTQLGPPRLGSSPAAHSAGSNSHAFQGPATQQRAMAANIGASPPALHRRWLPHHGAEGAKRQSAASKRVPPPNWEAVPPRTIAGRHQAAGSRAGAIGMSSASATTRVQPPCSSAGGEALAVAAEALQSATSRASSRAVQGTEHVISRHRGNAVRGSPALDGAGNGARTASSPAGKGSTEASPSSPLPPLWEGMWDIETEQNLYCQEMFDASDALDLIEG